MFWASHRLILIFLENRSTIQEPQCIHGSAKLRQGLCFSLIRPDFLGMYHLKFEEAIRSKCQMQKMILLTWAFLHTKLRITTVVIGRDDWQAEENWQICSVAV